MAFTQNRLALAGDSPGSSTDFIYYTAGPETGGPKIYLQAALHADEQPGTMVLHHFLPLLRDADAQGRVRARFIVMPMVNPLGMANMHFREHIGRYDPNTGLNYNRRWPDLYAAVGSEIGERLGDDAVANVAMIREAVGAWIKRQVPTSAAQQLRLFVLELMHDADMVLDLHCDNDSLSHIFTSPELMPGLQDLADWMGVAATLTAADSGGGSFDEMLPILYRRTGAETGKPVPIAAETATLEYRGQAEVFDHLGREDARRLLGFFAGRGLIEADVGPVPGKAPPPTPFEATEVVRVERPGMLAYRVELGDVVKKGQPIADLIALDGPEAFIGRTPILAGTDGIVLSRVAHKYRTRGASVAKIVGTTALPSRGTYLLED